jgi:hypothetical protein
VKKQKPQLMWATVDRELGVTFVAPTRQIARENAWIGEQVLRVSVQIIPQKRKQVS